MEKKQMKTMMVNKGEKLAKHAAGVATAVSAMITYPYVFFATNAAAGNSSGGDFSVTVDMSSVAQHFSKPDDIAGIIVGLALWICQLVGIGMLIWGIYGYVTARKDGEAESMNGAIGKLVSGCVLIGMKGILNALHIVS